MRIHYPAVGVIAMLTSIVVSIVPADAVPAVPYSDYSAQGLITLCDRAGHPVTTGQITDKPFVWRAVSSQPASAAYSGHGQTATLLAYQPRPHAYPPQWSGDTLTSSSTYTNPAAPMAQATRLDFTLQDFLHEFPPMMNGFIQLRIYLGIPGKETLTTTYPSADIQVTGSTWTLVVDWRDGSLSDAHSALRATLTDCGIDPDSVPGDRVRIDYHSYRADAPQFGYFRVWVRRSLLAPGD